MPESSRILVNLNSILIKDSQITEECILFGFPYNRDTMHTLNFCILYAKYYIYIQCLFNNNTLDQHALKIEENLIFLYINNIP